MEISQSNNILNWYPFNSNKSILIIGKNQKELYNMLNEKNENLTYIQEYTQDSLTNLKFDYIILIGILENWKDVVKIDIKLKQLLKNLSNSLNENGKILLAIDNKFGIRFFSGNPEKILNRKFESLIGYSNEPEKIESFTKSKLENMLSQLNLNYRFYYPLPDYKLPNVIFTDDQLPEYNSIDKYYPYYEKNSEIIFNEIDVFREILKSDKEMFTFFTNSFLVEISKGECNKEYKYISFNNIRKKDYQLITKISNTYVEKQTVTQEAQKHYDNIKENIKILNENNIKTVDYIENDIIKSKYINQEFLLNNVLTQKLEEGNEKEFYDIIDKYLDIISINLSQEDYEKTIFKKYDIEIEDKNILKDLHFLKNGLWDMTFKNCFYINNEFLFFDQEWEEDNLPVEYILYRSILYTISLRRYIKIEKLYEKYNLTKFIDLFEKLDNKLQETIRDNKTWEFYSENHYINLDDTIQEMKNLNIRDEAKDGRIKQLEQENKELKEKLNTGFFRKVQKVVDKIKK